MGLRCCTSVAAYNAYDLRMPGYGFDQAGGTCQQRRLAMAFCAETVR